METSELPPGQREAVEKAVDLLEKCTGNRTLAWNIWNNINSDSDFIRTFAFLHGFQTNGL